MSKIRNINNNKFKLRTTLAKYWIPTEDEWYKAAYYDPTLNSGSGGYWTYATQSNSIPTPVTANSVGDGSAGPSGNFANYNRTANWNNTTNGNVTTVGTNGGPSYYGTFDQSGNATEWNDGTPSKSSIKGRRGGDWEDGSFLTISATGGRRTINNQPSAISSDLGFRICSSIYNNDNNFVIINNINNIADSRIMNDGTTNYGSVNYEYKISKYLVTNNEYVEFLNSVGINDIYNIYIPQMSDDIQGIDGRGGIIRQGTQGNYSYSVKSNMGNKPVVYVNWLNCARYCNWLHNGKPSGNQDKNTTESGAYSLYGTMSGIFSNKNSFKIRD